MLGFFTTRFVRADSPTDAAARARAFVDSELRPLLVDQSVEDVLVEVDEIAENPPNSSRYAPGGGFSWYLAPADGADQAIH